MEQRNQPLSDILDEITGVFRQHFVAKTPYAHEIMALFGAFTWAFPRWAEHNPHLAIVAPYEACGKTQAAIATGSICRAPYITGNASVASLRRRNLAERTLVLDEGDTFMSGDEFTNFLNSSWSRETAFQERCVEGPGGKWEAQEFSTWCPIIFSRIGDVEPPSVRSRCFVVRMRRAKAGEVPRFTKEVKSGLAKLGPKLGAEVAKLRGPWNPTSPLTDMRAIDNWRLMLGIADEAGGHWPETARAAAGGLVEESEPSNFV